MAVVGNWLTVDSQNSLSCEIIYSVSLDFFSSFLHPSRNVSIRILMKVGNFISVMLRILPKIFTMYSLPYSPNQELLQAPPLIQDLMTRTGAASTFRTTGQWSFH